MNDSGLHIGSLSVSDPAWASLLTTGAGATPFHAPDLVVAVGAGTRRRPMGVGAWSNGQLVGGVVVLVPDSGPPSPLSPAAYNGPVLASPPSVAQSSRDRWTSQVAGGLLDGVRAIHPHTVLRMVPMVADVRATIASGWSYHPTFTFVMDLTDLDRAWDGLDRNRRRLVRRAAGLGYVVEELDTPTPGAVADVVRLHSNQQSGYGLSGELDQTGWSALLSGVLGSGVGRLFVARSPRGHAVAFQLLTTCGTDAANLMTGTDAAHLAAGVNGMLRWEVCTSLHAAGVKHLDLNGAKPGESGRFKASFGARLVERWDLSVPYRHGVRDFPSRVVGKLRRTAANYRRAS